MKLFFSETLSLLKQAGLECPVVSHGGSPSLFDSDLVPSATEHRAGTYIFNDRSMVRAGMCDFDDCAMHVLATVVSRPTANRAVLDAGSKALTSDLLGFSDHGLLIDYPEASIAALSEEHAVVDLTKSGKNRRSANGSGSFPTIRASFQTFSTAWCFTETAW